MDFDSTNLVIDCEEGPIGEKDFTLDDFSYEAGLYKPLLLDTIAILNGLKRDYELENDPKIKKSILLEIMRFIPLSYNWKKFVTVDIDKAVQVTESKRGSDYFEWELFEIFLKNELIPYIQIEIPIRK
jgi:hypothetical protein